jgi:hypothetical protein
MTWNPTIAQLCKIAELRHARAPVETIARELHIEAECFIAWRQQCMLAASEETARLQRPEPMPVALVDFDFPILQRMLGLAFLRNGPLGNAWSPGHDYCGSTVTDSTSLVFRL